MRRTLVAGAVLVAALLFFTLPAQAKGEGGSITIKNSSGTGGPGFPAGGGRSTGGGGGGDGAVKVLSAPIHIRGERSAFWFESTGFGETLKPAQPQELSGAVVPRANLGPALSATASFLCGKDEHGTIHQTIFPYAKGGPQVYTPAGQSMCGMSLAKGWYNSEYSQMWDTLVAHGLPKHAPAVPVAPAAAASDAATAGADHTPWNLIAVAIVALASLLLLTAVAQRRRARAVA
jgi:hypothetical protein